MRRHCSPAGDSGCAPLLNDLFKRCIREMPPLRVLGFVKALSLWAFGLGILFLFRPFESGVEGECVAARRSTRAHRAVSSVKWTFVAARQSMQRLIASDQEQSIS